MMTATLIASLSSRNFKFSFSPTVCLAVLSVVLSGCSAFPAKSNNKWSEFSGKVDAHGSLPVMHHEFNILPFVEMLEDAEGKATCIQKNQNNEFTTGSYQCATKKFYARTRLLPAFYQRLERNRIQERILAVSEDRCNAYKRYLRYDQSMSNFWLGFGSTVAGGLGALSGTLTAAKSFAAFGGVLSGISAEYNQDFYGNLFYSVITKAIDEQRRDAYRQIQTYGQGKSLSEYPVEAAIKDAIVYDGTCSAVSAMEYAEKAVQLVNDPGMDGMMRYLIKANQSRYILQNEVKDISDLKKAGITSTFENSRFGSQIGNKDKDEFHSQPTIQLELYKATHQTTKNILAAVGQQYAGDNTNKLAEWQKKDLTELARKIEEQRVQIFKAFETNLSQCSQSATDLYSNFMAAETQLQQADNDKITECTIKRDQAQNKVQQINMEISGLAQHFQALIDSLTKSALDSVSSNNNMTWNYTKLPKEIKFSDKSCEKFKPK